MRTASGKKGTVPICRHGPEGASHKWGLSPFFIRDHRPKRAGRRGRASPTTFGVLAGAGVLVVLILGAWWAGWLPGTGRRQDVSPAVRQPPAAELNIEVAMPLDAAGGSSGPSLSQSLAALSGAAAAKAGPLDDAARFAALAPRDSWGDHRQAAEGGASPARCWEIRFLKGHTKEKYARQLDYFGIELAVVMPDDKLVYVREFSKAKPHIRSGPADAEKRWYLTWREGDLSRADADLLAAAGVSTNERIVLKILPPEVEARLAELERASAGDDIADVGKTRFGIREAADGYEFYVIEQFRKERAKK